MGTLGSVPGVWFRRTAPIPVGTQEKNTRLLVRDGCVGGGQGRLDDEEAIRRSDVVARNISDLQGIAITNQGIQ